MSSNQKRNNNSMLCLAVIPSTKLFKYIEKGLFN